MKSLILFFCIFCLNLFSNTIVIGESDKIDFIDFSLKNINARIDTGAKTSSLHCSYINISDDKKYVFFKLLDKRYKEFDDKIYKSKIVDFINVRSSNGISENRVVIETNIIVFDKIYKTKFSLRNREKMTYPVLLGREFLKNGFVVDIREKELSFKEKINKD